MSDAFLEFNDVFVEDMGLINRGRVKLSDSSVVFKNEKTGKLITYQTVNLESVEWMRLANQPGLRMAFDGDEENKGRFTFRLGGFKESDYEKIGKFIDRNWNKKVLQSELAIKGWNYGKAQVNGATLEFSVDGKLAFEVPLQNVSKCTAGKNEATLEFHSNDDAPVTLQEIRFFLPDDGEGLNDERVDEFRAAVMKFAGIEAEAGNAVATLEEILCTTPRGRYDIKVYPNHLSLHGKTYDYKIPVKTITRLFLLPHKDGRHMYFVISLNPPIRQGQTRYHFLVLEFVKDDHIDLPLGMPQDQLDELYHGKLTGPELSGPVFEVVSKIFRVLVNMRITVPGNFVGHSGTPAVVCAHRQASGFLYPLEKGFLYIHKPPMYVRFEEVSSVHFARSDVSTRSFDFEIELKAGQTLVFNSVEKEEYNKLYDFVQNKRLRIRNAKKMEKNYAEDQFAGSDDEFDPYKETVKAEGKEKGRDSDESDTDDEDYDLDQDLAQRRKLREEADSSAGDESEPEEEFDSEAGEGSHSGSGSAPGESEPDEEDVRPRKKVKKNKEGGGEKKTRKSKKEKDPNAPKRPQSAYFLWLNHNRSSIKKDGDSVADVARKAGEIWKQMSSEDKKTYEEKAAADRERYEGEKKEYNKSGGSSATTAKAAGGNTATASKKTKTSSPAKSVKSKEFVESEESSSSEDDDKPLKPSTSAEGKKKGKKKKQSSDGSASSPSD